MRPNYRTTASSASLTGKGIHSGLPVTLTISPAPGRGITFSRKNLGSCEVQATPASLKAGGRCTVLSGDGWEIATVEHFLAAVSVLRVTDLLVEVNGPEMPAGDGSAQKFVELLDAAGLVETKLPFVPYHPAEPMIVESSSGRIALYPADELIISYFLDLSALGLGFEKVEYHITESTFRDTIARARTFVPAPLVPKLLEQGFGKGADAGNTLVVGAPDSVPRFPNEAAAHKVLDILGDLAAIGVPVVGRIEARGTGHAQNAELAARIVSALGRRNSL